MVINCKSFSVYSDRSVALRRMGAVIRRWSEVRKLVRWGRPEKSEKSELVGKSELSYCSLRIDSSEGVLEIMVEGVAVAES